MKLEAREPIETDPVIALVAYLLQQQANYYYLGHNCLLTLAFKQDSFYQILTNESFPTPCEF